MVTYTDIPLQSIFTSTCNKNWVICIPYI